MTTKAQSRAIHAGILKAVRRGEISPSIAVAKEFGVSRQAIARRIRKMIEDGELEESGRSRFRKLALKTTERRVWNLTLQGLDETIAWRETVAPAVSDLPENVRAIWMTGFTEMVNNAIDHSGGASVELVFARTAIDASLSIKDNGEGIFRRIQRLAGYYDPREALLDLAKGKFTTDPERHSGEGIFFTSRAFDKFYILSGDLFFTHHHDADWLLDHDHGAVSGTLVHLNLLNDTERTMRAVYAEFSDPNSLDFSKTVVPVRLARHEGEKLVSRSQAKRLVARFDMFRTVYLDFTGVAEIGQAFADEVFRVFATAHPEVSLTVVNAVSDVQDMIVRATAPRE
ncbi:STAS-like domain-containing protein [Acidithiobacillus caldus]|uniref:STAS-like domain-containing protein n=1 Tax=Acidithiobacillus caldus TaxID=33059 RepID=UPI001D02BEF1|nr:DUF4325 domain-containing protein [Acidithiobacillus caldus]